MPWPEADLGIAPVAEPETVEVDVAAAPTEPALAPVDVETPAAEEVAEAEAAAVEAEPAVAEPEPAVVEPEVEAPVAAPEIVPLPQTIIAASVDVGALSSHLLVAAVTGHRVEPLLDESSFLGLGDRVATNGFIGSDARADLVANLAEYADKARALGATSVTFVGTEPLRRAADATALVYAVQDRAGAPLHVLDHDEEAMLMLLGVTAGMPVTSELLVVDIGGGSSEIIIVGPNRAVDASGLRIGSASLTQEHSKADPPTLKEIDAMRSGAKAAVANAPDARPTEIIAVGGTASNLLKRPPATAIDRMLTRRRITVALAMLTVQRSSEAAERHLLRPQRARVLPAGALIVDAILERYGTDRLRVSNEGIPGGVGPSGRDRGSRVARPALDAGHRLA